MAPGRAASTPAYPAGWGRTGSGCRPLGPSRGARPPMASMVVSRAPGPVDGGAPDGSTPRTRKGASGRRSGPSRSGGRPGRRGVGASCRPVERPGPCSRGPRRGLGRRRTCRLATALLGRMGPSLLRPARPRAGPAAGPSHHGRRVPSPRVTGPLAAHRRPSRPSPVGAGDARTAAAATRLAVGGGPARVHVARAPALVWWPVLTRLLPRRSCPAARLMGPTAASSGRPPRDPARLAARPARLVLPPSTCRRLVVPPSRPRHGPHDAGRSGVAAVQRSIVCSSRFT